MVVKIQYAIILVFAGMLLHRNLKKPGQLHTLAPDALNCLLNPRRSFAKPQQLL